MRLTRIQVQCPAIQSRVLFQPRFWDREGELLELFDLATKCLAHAPACRPPTTVYEMSCPGFELSSARINFKRCTGRLLTDLRP